MQLNPFLSVIYLMGKLFKLISQNICKKILCWRITFLTRQCNGGITDELFWVEVGPILYWETTSHNPLRSQWAVPLSPPAASRVFIKFELGLKSVIRCLISGNRTHRIIPVQTTSPAWWRHQADHNWDEEDGGEASFSHCLGLAESAWTLMTRDMLHLGR